MESDIKRIMSESLPLRILFSTPWTIGPAIYALGLLLASTTGNLTRFLTNYPWACLVAAATIAIWASPRLTERHGLYTIAVRGTFNVTDDEFKTFLEKNMRRLVSTRNLVD
jgi:hypothetical protein